jgi:heterodisulfide reductase subunit A
MSCNGCGACVSICDEGCLTIPNFTTNSLKAEAKGLLKGTEGEVTLLGFFDDNISYTAADNAGTARIHYPTNMRIMRLPSTALFSDNLVLSCFAMGADGIMICEVEETPEAELATKLVERVREKLSQTGIEPDRIRFQPMVLPIFKMLPKFITDFNANVSKWGKIPEEKRSSIK